MKFRIHFKVPDVDGQQAEDSVVVEGDTVEQIREKADSEVLRRGGIDPWSEELL